MLIFYFRLPVAKIKRILIISFSLFPSTLRHVIIRRHFILLLASHSSNSYILSFLATFLIVCFLVSPFYYHHLLHLALRVESDKSLNKYLKGIKEKSVRGKWNVKFSSTWDTTLFRLDFSNENSRGNVETR